MVKRGWSYLVLRGVLAVLALAFTGDFDFAFDAAFFFDTAFAFAFALAFGCFGDPPCSASTLARNGFGSQA